MVPGTQRTAKHGLGLLAVAGGATTIGLAPIFVRLASPAGPLVVGFYRMAIALPLVLVLALRDEGAWNRRGLAWAMLAGAFFFGDLSLWHTAIGITGPSVATLFVCLAPLWVSAFTSVVLRKPLSARGWTGLLLAVGGASVLALAGGSGRLGGIGVGELTAAAASFSYAGYTMALSKARESTSAPKALLASIVVAVVLFGAASGVTGERFGGFPPGAWLALVALGVVVQTLAWLSISWGLGHVEARIGSLSLLVQPVSTMVLGHVLLGEQLSRNQLVGGFLVLFGMAVAVVPARAPDDAQTTP